MADGKAKGTRKPKEWEDVRKDEHLGVIPDSNPYWEQYGVSPNFIRAVRLDRGLPAVSRPQPGIGIRKKIRADPKVTTASLQYLAEKYDTSRSMVTKAIKEGKIQRDTPNFHPKYIPPWHTTMMEEWRRPAGIDKHLEQICS